MKDQMVELPCAGSGIPSPLVRLLRDVDSRDPTECSECVLDLNIITFVRESDAGEYFCVAANTLVRWMICVCSCRMLRVGGERKKGIEQRREEEERVRRGESKGERKEERVGGEDHFYFAFFFPLMQVNPPLGKRTMQDWKTIQLIVETGV